MTTITGRLTKDAKIQQLSSEATVVNFTIAVNDWYKPKNGEAREVVEFIQCSFWMNAAIGKILKKGALVEAGGRLFATAYQSGNDVKGQINLMVQHVKVHVFAKNEEPAQAEPVQLELQTQPEQTKGGTRRKPAKRKPQPEVAATGEGPKDDLPF